MHDINKKCENLLHLSKVAPKNFWRQILTSKSKENNKIALKDWDSYLKNIYESLNVTNNTLKTFLQRRNFSH